MPGNRGMAVRIKFCGMTRAEDVQCAVDLGVDALGFVFVEKSHRRVTVETARNLMERVPPFVTCVGLFMNAEPGDVETVMRQTGLGLLQFHGSEDEDHCRQFGIPYLKAVPVRSTPSVTEFCADFSSAAGFVMDSHAVNQMGGSGRTFAWDRIPDSLGKPVVLAGGLKPENVALAVRQVRPHAVDVSSGIETSPGMKDAGKMKKFIEEARHGLERA